MKVWGWSTVTLGPPCPARPSVISPRYFSFGFGSSQPRMSSLPTSKPTLWRVCA